jgi:hypothetical protein
LVVGLCCNSVTPGERCTQLTEASERGAVEEVRRLLARADVDVNKTNKVGVGGEARAGGASGQTGRRCGAERKVCRYGWRQELSSAGGAGVRVESKAAIRPGKLYPDTEPWAERAIRITVHGYPDISGYAARRRSSDIVADGPPQRVP